MEINKESFDKKVKVVLNTLKGKDPVIQLTASLCFALLKYEIFDQEEQEKEEEEKREEKTEEKEPVTVDFPIALSDVLYDCKKAKRRGWNGKDQYIERGEARYREMGGREYLSGGEAIVFHGTSGVQVGWLASQGDMLANDWIVFD